MIAQQSRENSLGVMWRFVYVPAVLACLFYIPRVANATCGEYVLVRNTQGELVRASTLATTGQLEYLRDRGAPCQGPNCIQARMSDQLPAWPHGFPVRIPCSGPQCSSRSKLPATPAPRPAPQRGTQEVCALLVSAADSYGSHSLLERLSAADMRELHFPQAIFHPPR